MDVQEREVRRAQYKGENGMRRPVVWGAAALCAGIATRWAIGPAGLLLAVGIALLAWRRARILGFLLLAGALLLHVDLERPDPLDGWEGRNGSITGRVVRVEEGSARDRLVLRTGPGPASLLVRFPGHLPMPASLIAGRVVEVGGTFERPDPARNPRSFDYRAHLWSRHVSHILSAAPGSLRVVGEGDRLAGPLQRARHRFRDELGRRLDPIPADLLYGMLFGDSAALDPDLRDRFRDNGTAHILAVSGIHVGIAYGAVRFCLRRSPKGGRLAAAALFLLAYAALAGWSPSVIRASLMIGAYIACQALHWRYDLLSAAALAAFVQLAADPRQLFQTGFQLSFLAILLLAFLLPLGAAWLERLRQAGTPAFAAGLLAVALPLLTIQAGMVPVNGELFRQVPGMAAVINLPVVALTGLLVPYGLLVFAFDLVGFPLPEAAWLLGEGMLRAMEALNRVPGWIGLEPKPLGGPGRGGLLLLYGTAFLFLSETFWRQIRRRALRPISILFLCLCLAAGVLHAGEDRRYRTAEMVFVDVGQGDCLHIRTPAGKNILIDGGGSAFRDVGGDVLLPYLLGCGIRRLDLVVATHLHEDHFGGLATLSHRLPVEALAVYDDGGANQATAAEAAGLPLSRILGLSAGDSIAFGPSVRIAVLHPPSGDQSEDENRTSLVLRVEVEGVSVLMTGDIGNEGESALLGRYGAGPDSGLRSDILKIAHHGSRFSSGVEFLAAVDPALAVIQVGRNNFGHPHPDVIEKLEKNDIMYFRTDRDGAILIDTEGGRARASPMIR